jgi:signal transduction histidine kinase
MNDEKFDAAALMPCVTYRCGSDLVTTWVSGNSFDLIGICPENIVGTRLLWEDRLRSEDRDRLTSRLHQLRSNQTASLTHAIANDQGLYLSVAHGFRKESAGSGYTIYGCLMPLSEGTGAEAIDSSIVPQFVHKIGNHFQLIHLLIGSLKRTGSNLEEIEALQLTVDRAVEFTRAFAHYTQAPMFTPSVELGEILRAVIESATSWCEEKKIVFRQNVLECLEGATLMGDAYLLELAFAALLQNALEATPSENEIVVTGKRAKKRSGEGSMARIVIADTGCGMDKNMLAKAARPFVTSKRDRNGLGLSTASRIVELHGGRLKVASIPDQGTKVEVLLPVKFPRDAAEL